MPTTRDYLIATIMGENNRGTVESQQGVLDTIINRQGNPTEYGARRGASVQDIVTARTPTGGYQYDAWRPELNGRPNGQFALSSAALQGRDNLSGAAQRQYDQIARVVDDYLDNGVGRGITQGATFYQTPDAPNAWQRNSLWPRFGQITVGDHIYSGPGLVRDRAEFERRNPDLFTSQQAPAPQQDGFGVIFNPSQGYDAGPSGSLGGLTGLFETLPYGTSPNSGPGDALGNGNGAFDLGGAYPNQDTNPLAFGSGVNVGGGDAGSFGGFLPPLQTGGTTNFSGLNPGDALGTGNGSFGNGISPYGQPPGPNDFSNTNVSGGVGPGSLNPGLSLTPPSDTASTIGAPAASGGLPPFFSPVDYVNANPDLAAAGITPQTAAQHYLDYGQYETRALAPWLQAQVHAAPGGSQTIGAPGLSPTLGPSTTPTLGSGSTASTIGAPNAISGLPPGFNEQAYLIANPDVAASGQSGADHFLRWGQFDVRALAPGEEARVHAAPGSISPYGGTVQASTLGPFGTTPTIGPDGGINVVSTGLTPTVAPGSTVQAFSPSGGNDFLTMPSTTATTLGPPATSNSLPAFFSPQDYIAANRDLAGMTNQQAIDHYTNYGQYEARALAPWLQAQVHAAPGLTPTIGAGNPVSTIGAPSLTPTLDTATPVSTIGPPALTGTYGPPATTPTLNPPMTTPSWSPFGGAGIGSPFGFSGSNVGGGLGAGPQTFGSYYPVGSGGTDTAPASSGTDMSNPFGFTNMDVSGFDANAYGGGGGGGGGSEVDLNFGSGFDEAGAMRNVLAQQAEALRLKDLAVKTPMHTDPNAFNAVLANGGNAVGFGTPLQNPGAVQAPVVPNLTVTNAAMGAPGAMFSMFAPWR